MSHSKERAEKICLNCSNEVYGRYCHKCGQENIEPKESTWGLITHFMYDITHFDGKFFSTLRYLLLRPGFLPKEFISGRRASYLHPIRMYVFTSALFFIVFYSMVNVRDMNFGSKAKARFVDSARAKIADARLIAMESAETAEDSIRISSAFNLMESADIPMSASTDSSRRFKPLVNFNFAETNYQNKKEYDSIQSKLPAHEKDNWFQRRMVNRSLYINEVYAGDGDRFLKDLLDKFIHSTPYMLFVSLPLYALFLKLLYIRRRQFFYVDHGIFLIYLYIYTFILLLIIFGFSRLDNINGFGWVRILIAGLFIYGIWYTLKAMRRFYQQGWGKTILKFLIFNFLCSIVLVILFTIFFTVTIFQV